MSNENQLAAPAANQGPMQIGESGAVMRSLDDYYQFANILIASGMCPKGLDKPEAIMIALQFGAELGLKPMAAVQNIAPINGRPSIWGDAMLAVCRSTGTMEEFGEWFEQKGQRIARAPLDYPDDTTAVCRVKRQGMEAVEGSFSVAEAKKAGLWGKQGPWTQYPQRMLKFRARSFALRDCFGDALRGIQSAEEVMDIEISEPPRNVTPPAPASYEAPAALPAPAGEEAPKQQQRRKRATPAAEAPSAAPAENAAPERSSAPESTPEPEPEQPKGPPSDYDTPEDAKERAILIGQITERVKADKTMPYWQFRHGATKLQGMELHQAQLAGLRAVNSDAGFPKAMDKVKKYYTEDPSRVPESDPYQEAKPAAKGPENLFD